MKVGRNAQCPCGSGKKYKKCCLNIGNTTQSFTPKNKSYFRLKGLHAEEWITELAEKTFISDWCYPNPRLPDGKELCDLLIVYDDTAIIWQIKDLKLGDDGKYSHREVQKNLRQVIGARRQLVDLKTPLTLTNPRRGTELFDPSKIKTVHLISALVGSGEDHSSFMEEYKKHTVHVFSREFIEIALNELDTISDFCYYLDKKEHLVRTNTHLMVLGGEKELLGFFLLNNRSFERISRSESGKVASAIIDEGIWREFTSRPEVTKRDAHNHISYLWDELINIAHECGSDYEQVARELARPNRFFRRILSKAFYDGSIRAAKEVPPLFRRLIDIDGVTYCFIFTDNTIDRESRKDALATTAFVARGIKKENKKVVGIATEKGFSDGRSFDFVFIELPEWTAVNEATFNQVRRDTEIFLNPKLLPISESEYPK